MKCEETKINLPEYIDGKLDKITSEMVDSHLRNCASCKQLYTELSSFLKFTGSFPDIEPPQGMKKEFIKLAGMEEKQPKERILGIPEWLKVAAIIVIALGTFTSGYFAGSQKNEVTQLKSELNAIRKEVLLAGLSDYSAPQKIEAVYNIKTSGSTDSSLINALVYTMNSDKNVNVRLAAINALSEMMDKNENIKTELIRSLSVQENPLLQISLIQVLTESGVKEAREKIEAISDDENTNQQVREYARNMIKTII